MSAASSSLHSDQAAHPDGLTEAALHAHNRRHKSTRHRDPAAQTKSILRPSHPTLGLLSTSDEVRREVPVLDRKHPSPPSPRWHFSRRKLLTGTPITIRLQLEKEYSPEIVRCYPPVLISSLFGGPFSLGEPYEVTLERLSGGTIPAKSRRTSSSRIKPPNDKIPTTTQVTFKEARGRRDGPNVRWCVILSSSESYSH